MPTIAVSSRVSDAIYLASIIMLTILLARPVYLVYSGSQERAAQVVASGLGKMLDSMSPGVSVETALQSYPGVSYSVVLGSGGVTAYFGKSSATAAIRWHLPHVILTPGEAYTFRLEGSDILVEQGRHG